MSTPPGAPRPRPDADADQQRFVVVTQDGMGVSEREGEENGADQPGRPGRAAGQGHADRLDDQAAARGGAQRPAGRGRAHAACAEIHRRSIAELKQGLAPELIEELDRIALPFATRRPRDAELRIAQAQLVGWLEGLFHGIQTALFAQQMAAQAQLQQMRALPAGHPAHPDHAGHQGPPGSQPGSPGRPGSSGEGGPTGQYL